MKKVKFFILTEAFDCHHWGDGPFLSEIIKFAKEADQEGFSNVIDADSHGWSSCLFITTIFSDSDPETTKMAFDLFSDMVEKYELSINEFSNHCNNEWCAKAIKEIEEEIGIPDSVISTNFGYTKSLYDGNKPMTIIELTFV